METGGAFFERTVVISFTQKLENPPWANFFECTSSTCTIEIGIILLDIGMPCCLFFFYVWKPPGVSRQDSKGNLVESNLGLSGTRDKG